MKRKWQERKTGKLKYSKRGKKEDNKDQEERKSEKNRRRNNKEIEIRNE